ncbi:hypothetical protein AVEN_264520-1 [Araneus ventricosus]|uniref:Uncharacterized protein n=1 Tax=Araneus ventricosus TaxID=182803 RepID=A0A4Y2G6L8_ARAVE|nr:hypothetical protein AVEN_264520-1 [Araneus ventricosus]
MGHLQVSVCELFNVINMGSQSRRPTRVPLLIELHKVLLLSWARQHYHWTVDDWKHVTWSDESRFQLYRTDARVRLEAKSGKMSGINVGEYLTADDDLMAFAGVTEEDILSEMTDEMENDDDDTDPPTQS